MFWTIKIIVKFCQTIESYCSTYLHEHWNLWQIGATFARVYGKVIVTTYDSSCLTSFRAFACWIRFSMVVGIGKSAMDFIWDNSLTLLLWVTFWRSLRTSAENIWPICEDKTCLDILQIHFNFGHCRLHKLSIVVADVINNWKVTWCYLK